MQIRAVYLAIFMAFSTTSAFADWTPLINFVAQTRHRDISRTALIRPGGQATVPCAEIMHARENLERQAGAQVCANHGYRGLTEGEIRRLSADFARHQQLFTNLGRALTPPSQIGLPLVGLGVTAVAVGGAVSAAEAHANRPLSGAYVAMPAGAFAATAGTMSYFVREGSHDPHVYLRAISDLMACAQHGASAGAHHHRMRNELYQECLRGQVPSPQAPIHASALLRDFRDTPRAHPYLDIHCLTRKLNEFVTQTQTEAFERAEISVGVNTYGDLFEHRCEHRVTRWRGTAPSSSTAAIPTLAVGRPLSREVREVPQAATVPSARDVLINGAATLIVGPAASSVLPGVAPALRAVAH